MSITIDGPNKLFIADPGTVVLELLDDLYEPYKDWLLAGNMQFLPAFAIMPVATPGLSDSRVVGGNTIEGTKSIPTYLFLTNGWRIRPQELDHTLGVRSAILVVEGGGDPFVDTIGAFTVRINYEQPVQAITVDATVIASTIAAAVWNELLTGGTHNIQNSAGKRLRDLASQVVHTDTAQGPAANGNQIELALAASSIDGTYDPSMIFIRDGTGSGQSRLILQYTGSTRIATVDRNWKVNPDATSEYVILAHPGREHVNEGLVQAATSNTITLNTLASSIDNVYLHQTIFIRSGTGDDQVGIVTAYNGTTKVATIDGIWAVTPDSTSGYVMLPSRNNVQTEQFSAYNNEISIDVAGGTAGSLYPLGTAENPVNNLADAKILGVRYGITTFRVVDTLTIGATDNIDGLEMKGGTNELVDLIILTAGCSTEKTKFKDLTVAGVAGGGIICQHAAISNLSNIGTDTSPGILFDECLLLAGTHTLKAGLTTPQNVQFRYCITGLGGAVNIDYNGADQLVGFRGHSGALTFSNYTGGQESIVEFAAGEITLDATCTSGTARIRGIVDKINNNSTGTFTVKRSLLSRIASVVKSLQ